MYRVLEVYPTWRKKESCSNNARKTQNASVNNCSLDEGCFPHTQPTR